MLESLRSSSYTLYSTRTSTFGMSRSSWRVSAIPALARAPSANCPPVGCPAGWRLMFMVSRCPFVTHLCVRAGLAFAEDSADTGQQGSDSRAVEHEPVFSRVHRFKKPASRMRTTVRVNASLHGHQALIGTDGHQ